MYNPNSVRKPNMIAMEKFAEHYVIHNNASSAYKYAFPEKKDRSVKSLTSYASRYLHKPKVQEMIALKKEELKETVLFTKEAFINNLVDAAKKAKDNRQFAAYNQIMTNVGKLLDFYNNQIDLTSNGEKINIVLNLGDNE